jgi:pyruvate kinase
MGASASVPKSAIFAKVEGAPDKFKAELANKPLEPEDKPRATKVTATLGPASWTEEMVPEMIRAGVNIFRMNCSHRRGGVFEEVYPRLRKYAAELNTPIMVLGDLQGPKFRNGELKDDKPVELVKGKPITISIATGDADLTRDDDGAITVTMTSTIEQTALLKGMQPGMRLLFDDGNMEVVCTAKASDTSITCEVIYGGFLKAKKGINAPDLEIDCAALTAKDIEDAEYLLQLDPPVDLIAVSFVQKGSDLQELIDIMDRLNIPAEKRPKICPKIEKPQALTNLDGIIEKSGALMVARGDLGVELGHQRVPLAQKLMIAQAKRAGLDPVINATQMMESMINNPVPTRAEVADVFNAVLDGADAVMLSGEAATGKYPVETVRMMGQICKEAEAAVEMFK